MAPYVRKPTVPMPPRTRHLCSTVRSTTTPHSLPLKASKLSPEHLEAIPAHSSSPKPDASQAKEPLQSAMSRAPSPVCNPEPEASEAEEPHPKAAKLATRESSMSSSEAPNKSAPAPKSPQVTEVSVTTESATSATMIPPEGTVVTINAANIPDSHRRTLADAMNETRAHGEAIREKLRKFPIIKSPPPTPSRTLDRSLVPTRGITGNLLIDSVIDDMQESRYCFWLAHGKKIIKYCDWVKNTVSNSYTLVWKQDCPLRPAWGDGAALIGWIGQVSGELSSLTPDAGWTYTKPDYDGDFHKKKRFVAVGPPEVNTRFPRSLWDDQVKGYHMIVDHARRSVNTKTAVAIGGSFYDVENGCLRARSPLFLPPPILVPDPDEQYNSDSDSELESNEGDEESDIPESHRYPTWSITLPRVESLFEKLIDDGYQPQILNAHDRFNTLIHPNNVHSTLNGALCYVYATLEKQLFVNQRLPGGRAWQFYANLVKVQALKAPSPPKPTAMKRKDIPGYNMADTYRNSSSEASSSKRVKF
ncbi:hypothetical protein FRC11_004571 [Ceratobasidium sp. 423]|nr:hypothetical protein FRC11_004571 [Ceratobasidium sp. 423]